MRNLILGTAQFGMGYGTYITYPPISKSNLKKILNLAISSNINLMDTALNYQGVIKNLTNQNLVKRFNICLKIQYNSIEESYLFKQLNTILNGLGHDSYGAILIHNWANLSKIDRTKGLNFLGKARDLGIVTKIGISVYETNELIELSKKIDIIQAPLNYFNLNFLRDKKVRILKERGTEFHARSIFNQGTLIRHTNLPPIFYHELLKFKEFSERYKLSYLQSALSIFDEQDIFSKLVIGVNSVQELSEIINCPIINNKIDLLSIVSDVSSEVMDPRRWKY